MTIGRNAFVCIRRDREGIREARTKKRAKGIIGVCKSVDLRVLKRELMTKRAEEGRVKFPALFISFMNVNCDRSIGREDV